MPPTSSSRRPDGDWRGENFIRYIQRRIRLLELSPELWCRTLGSAVSEMEEFLNAVFAWLALLRLGGCDTLDTLVVVVFL